MRAIGIIVAGALITAPAVAASQVAPQSASPQAATPHTATHPPRPTVGSTLGDIATQPLQDTNIKAKRVPEVLELARGDPYSTAGLRNCATITAEIDSLNAVLGGDLDTPEDRRVNHGQMAANVGKSVVQSLIPFRGVIREVTGAAGAHRQYESAVDAGMARRGFLRGTARARGCRVTG